jgi:hypothetical protein
MLLRLLAMVFLPGLGFAALGKYFPSGGSAVSPLFIAIVSVMGIAEIAIAVSAVRLWLGHYKEEEKEE